ncbi:DUF2207 domain-containing protein [Actinomadura darangshiensis]|uniref:DUF2207 domain-containing protein n=1 Tax=Actinomadura darangshiensis TaxID=705336 RepID=A0A4R5BXL4_9ACTN|nr:DUF2207 domain-containing protein [Actinomadura darangshiensis]TDD89082.1 DUF2207 domain-containing protein [Actinomadura darangshiensis]
MPDVRGRVRGPAIAAGVLLLTAVLGLPVLLGPTAGAAAAEPGPGVSRGAPPPEHSYRGESIPAYDVVLTIGTDGVLYVRETITYDFDRTGEHGIVRHVPFRRGDRLYDVRNVSSSSSTGAPARVRTTRFLHDVQISVGDRNREVRGRQAYVIEYEVGRAFTPRAGHDELVWDAIGTSWAVPIGNAAVRVEAPVPLRHATCRAGAAGATTRCLRDRDGPYAIDFIQNALAPHEGMKIRVRLPKHAIAVRPPRYVPPRWTGDWPGTAVLALALAAVPLLALRPAPRGRTGAGLVAAGLLLVVADAGDDIAARGPWAFSLGDRCLAGLALVIVGAGIVCVHRAGAGRSAPDGRPVGLQLVGRDVNRSSRRAVYQGEDLGEPPPRRGA